MTAYSLQAFQDITGLSDQSLLWLMKKDLLPVLLDPAQGLMVDVSKVEVRALVQAIAARKGSQCASWTPELKNQIEALISREVNAALEEALERVQGNSEAAQRDAAVPSEGGEP